MGIIESIIGALIVIIIGAISKKLILPKRWLAVFLAALGILLIVIFKANVYFILLIPIALWLVLILFEVVGDEAWFEGKVWGGKLKLGGTIAVFILIMVMGIKLIPDFWQAQDAVLKGIVTMQNTGNSIQGANVNSVSVANPDTTGEFGKFELNFLNKNIGDMVKLIAVKKGLEMVDPDKLRFAIRKNPDEYVRIVMRREGYGKKYEKAYISIAIQNIKRNYEIAKKEKSKDIAILTKQRDAALVQVKNTAKTFANIDLSQASELYNKAFNLFRNGKTDEALNILDDARIDKEVNEIEDRKRQITEIYILKAQLYTTKLKFKKALESYMEAEALNPENIFILINIGNVYDILGRYKEAKDYKERALPIAQKLYGEKNPLVAIIHNNIGVSWQYLGDSTKALLEFSKSFAIDLKEYGKDHPSVARDLNNLGEVWITLGNSTRAIEYFEKALPIAQKFYYHRIVTAIYNNLGKAWRNLDDNKKAIYYYDKALSIAQRIYSEEHFLIATYMNNLGDLYVYVGEYDRGIEYLKKALTTCERILGEDHPETKIVRKNFFRANFAKFLHSKKKKGDGG